MLGKFKVRFSVGAEDSYYYHIVYVHGLSADEATAFVKVLNVLGDLGLIGFDPATMMGDGDDDERPGTGWSARTRENGTEVWSRDYDPSIVPDHEVHVYPK